MKEPIRLNQDLVRQSLPEIPADFSARMEQMIGRLPAERKENEMKHKWSLGLVLALVLALLAVGAVAAVLLTPQQVVEQSAVPLAVGNDTAVRNIQSYSPEELAAFISAAMENGITLDENSAIMLAFRRGEGYWEDEAIRYVCRAAFGRNMEEWTLEQKSWYQDVMVSLGYAESNDYILPGEGDLTEDGAIALAMKALQEAYGADLPLDDPAVYGVQRIFSRWDDETGRHSFWTLQFNPRDLWHGVACANLADDMPVYLEYFPGPDPDNFRAVDLLDRMREVSGYFPGNWTPAQWAEYSALLRRGEQPADDSFDTPLLKVICATNYVLPGEGDITPAQAWDIALPEGLDPVYVHGSMLIEEEGRRIWKLCTGSQSRMWEIDAATGEILRAGRKDNDADQAAFFTTAATYARLFPTGDTLTESGIIALTIADIRGRGHDLPLDDESCYEIIRWKSRSADDERVYAIRFCPKVLDYPYAYAETSLEGQVRKLVLDESGDGFMDRFNTVYGWRGDWDQTVWIRLGGMLADQEVTTLEARLLKASTFPAVTPGLISRDDAVNAAIAYFGDRNAEDNGVVLLATADGHPVWKVHLLVTQAPAIRNTEVDAVTGEVLGWEPRVVDNTDVDPGWKDFILRETYRRVLMADGQGAMLARWAALYEYGDLEYDDCCTYLENEDLFRCDVSEDGLVCTFHPVSGDGPDYRVTLDESGAVVDLERIGDAEWHPSEEGFGGNG